MVSGKCLKADQTHCPDSGTKVWPWGQAGSGQRKQSWWPEHSSKICLPPRTLLRAVHEQLGAGEGMCRGAWGMCLFLLDRCSMFASKRIHYFCSSSHVVVFNVPKPRVTPNFMSTSTGRKEAPLLHDRHLLSSQELSSFLLGRHSLGDGSLWILPKWWQRQLARPRKFRVRKQNKEVNEEQRTGKTHGQDSL